MSMTSKGPSRSSAASASGLVSSTRRPPCHFQRPDRPQTGDQRAAQHRVGLDHLDGRGAGAQRLVDPKAAGGAEQQGACAGPQPVGQRIERGGEVGGVGLALARQGGDTVAVEVETEGTRQSLHAQPAGIVGEVAVEALDEAVDQEIVALRRADLGQHLATARVERREDVLELVHPGLVQQHEARLARQEDGEDEEAEPAARGMGPSLEPGRERQRRQEAGDELERRRHEHQRQHRHGAKPGAGQVGGIDAADLRGVEDEDERDIEADQEEEGEQRRVALGDVDELGAPQLPVLQLERIERHQRRPVPADGGRDHHQDGQQDEDRPGQAHQRARRQRRHRAAGRQPHHGDGDDPVAVLGPAREREKPRQRNLVSDRREAGEE